MNMYFQKLDFKVSPCDIDFTTFKGTYDYEYGNSDFTLKFYFIHDDLKARVKQLFSNFVEVAPNQIRFVEATGSEGAIIPPHKDHLLSSINYYFCASGASTLWYKTKDDIVFGRAAEYESDQIDLQDQFTAVNGDCYLFNSNQVHSVILGNGTRRFLQIQYGTPYDELFQKLVTFKMAEGKGIEPLIAESKSAVIPFN